MGKIRLIAFATAFWMRGKGIAGGDRRAIEIFRILKRSDKITIKILISEMGYNNYRSYIDTDFIILPVVGDGLGLVPSYIIRSIQGCLITLGLADFDVLYSVSDFLPDVLPAVAYKVCARALRKKRVRWIALLHLLAPGPLRGTQRRYTQMRAFRFSLLNAISYKVSQLISIFLMKWFADVVLVVNADVRQYLLRKGLEDAKVLIVNNCINLAEIDGIEALQRNKYDASFVGRLHPQKGILDLIDIWQQVCQKKKDARLVLIGSGSNAFEKEIKAQIKRKKLDRNIELTGFVDETTKIRLMKSSKMFLCPSKYESWAIVNAEAMVAGLPVVAYDLPAFAQIYERGMIRIPVGDTGKFTDVILELLDDRERRENLGGEARNFIRKYDCQEVAQKELAIIYPLTHSA